MTREKSGKDKLYLALFISIIVILGLVALFFVWKSCSNNDEPPVEKNSEASILLSGDITFVENMANVVVSNSQETFDLNEVFTLSEGATWVLANDATGSNIISDKICPLEEGDNVYYIIVTAEDEIGTSVYTLAVRRKPMYTVSFDTNGGTPVESFEVEEGTVINGSYSTSKPGYLFAGWYISGKKIYSSYIVKSDVVLVAKFNITNYELNISINNTNAGTVSEGDVYDYNDSVTLIATVNPGYTFNGWFFGEELVSADLEYTFNMPASDLSLEARFTANTNTPFTVNHYKQKEDFTYPSVPDEIEASFGTTNTYTSIDDKHYLGYTAKSFAQQIIKGDGSTVINIYYTINYYTINVSANNPNPFVYGGGTVTYNKEMTVYAVPWSGYTFNGWYEGNLKLSSNYNYTFNVVAGASLVAHYTANTYTITLDANGGTYDGESTYEVTFDDPFELPVVSKDSMIFAGWSYGDDIITDEYGSGSRYSIASDITASAYFVESSEQYNRDNFDYLYLGTYPQTLVEATEENGLASIEFNESTWKSYDYKKNNTENLKMYYLDVDMDEDGKNDYRGVYFKEYRGVSLFYGAGSSQDDYGYFINTIYWFSYDPIKWIILKTDGDKALVVTETIDAQYIYHAINGTRTNVTDYQGNVSSGEVANSNYMYSYIREWLNVSFYNTAFDSFEKPVIQKTTVYNGGDGEFSCDDTVDKLFLLSPGDRNAYYQRLIKYDEFTTDYAKSQGCDINSYGGTSWWMRGPRTSNGYCYAYGNISGSPDYVFNLNGVRAACWISLGNEGYVKIIVEDTEAGEPSGEGAYLVGNEVTLTANVNVGYTFNGWYEGENLLSSDLEYTFIMPSGDKEIKAVYTANAHTPYVYNYYMQNIDGTYNDIPTHTYNSNYYSGAVVEFSPYTYNGFETPEPITAKIKGDGSTAFNFYYIRKSYILTTSCNNEEGGSVTGSGTYKYEQSVTVVANLNEGYTFDGWYSNNKKVSSNLEYTFNMPYNDLILEARFIPE